MPSIWPNFFKPVWAENFEPHVAHSTSTLARTCSAPCPLPGSVFVVGCTSRVAFVTFAGTTTGYEWKFLCQVHAPPVQKVIPLQEWAVLEAERQLAGDTESDAIRRIFRLMRPTFTPRVTWIPGDVKSMMTGPTPRDPTLT